MCQGPSQAERGLNCSDDVINKVQLVVSLKNHTEVGGHNMMSVCDNSSRSGSSDLPQSIRTPHQYKMMIKCYWRQEFVRGPPVRRDTSPAVFKQRRRVVP
jgi:hypothetical protein